MYKHAPTAFWREKNVCYTEKKVAKCCEQQRERAAQPSKEPQRDVNSLVEK